MRLRLVLRPMCLRLLFSLDSPSRLQRSLHQGSIPLPLLLFSSFVLIPHHQTQHSELELYLPVLVRVPATLGVGCLNWGL